MEIGLSLGLTGRGQAPDAWVLRDDRGDAFLWDADFVAGRYYYNGTLYPTLSGWLTAIGATFGRASAAGYRDSTGAWAVASSGTLRQHRTAAAKGLGLVLEANRAQFLTSPTAPATQTQSLAAATYVCWLEGAGSVELSGGPTGTVTEGNPVTFTLGGTTAVTFTVSGDVTRFQCERDYPSTFMATSRTAADSLVIGPNGSSSPSPAGATPKARWSRGLAPRRASAPRIRCWSRSMTPATTSGWRSIALRRARTSRQSSWMAALPR
ncbi:hypothetical protein [Phenylobacterium sp. J367]|uniref:hypothetical protein n=1 Tax=Phenylobacterium sp. J367 TaxID=2898435 RepID=UPI002150F380|nr:hypothetical protein [Phenylobacterium sp. J367]MCR5876930.1 hypothetical protein [Phenylobacterium sp. J367]